MGSNPKVRQLEGLIKKAAKKYEGMSIALSGGIDSGLLAALIKPKFAINVELPGGDRYNESEIARQLAVDLGITLHVVKLSHDDFVSDCEKAFKIIGKPVPHFNIFPLYKMFQALRDVFKETDLVLGDGPDESMCGYTRHLIMAYLYNVYNFDAFKDYAYTIDKTLLQWQEVYADVARTDILWRELTSSFVPIDFLIQEMCSLDMEKKRPEMNIMADKLGEHFGIKVHRPYETKEVDEFMFNLPPELKIHKVEYGKYALRLIAEKYLPKEIAWQKHKVGGPVYPVNLKMGYNKTEGEFGKCEWLKWQRKVLNA